MLYFSDLNTLKMRSCVPLCRVGRFLRLHLLQAGQGQRLVSTLSPLGSAFNAKPSPRINFNPMRKNVVSITAGSDLSDLVQLHSEQVENFYLLVLGQVQMYKDNTIFYYYIIYLQRDTPETTPFLAQKFESLY